MRKSVVYFLILFSLVYFSGCETMQRKFTPKKKTPEHTASAIFFEEGAYQKKFSNDYYYKTHYTLWRTWHDELLENLGGNDKKIQRSAQESIGNLQQMQQYLKPDKYEQLEAVINDLSEVIKKLGDSGRTSLLGPIRTELERIRREVGNNFYYEKVKDSLLADRVDLGDQATSKTPAAA